MKARFIAAYALSTIMLVICAGCSLGPARTSNGTARVGSMRAQAFCLRKGVSVPLKAGMKLYQGDDVLTPEDSETFLLVNGFASAIKLLPSSDLSLEEMTSTVTGRSIFKRTIKRTVLHLKKGSFVGEVRKLAIDSTSIIGTPNGVATLDWGSLSVDVGSVDIGVRHVTFASVAGKISVSAELNGKTENLLLREGQQLETGNGSLETRPVSGERMAKIQEMLPIVIIDYFPPSPLPTPRIVQPFGGNGPPRQTAGSPKP